MAQKLIRDIPDEVMAAIEQKAEASPYKNSEAYIRNILVHHASEPIVRERYAYRFYNDTNATHGTLKRYGDGPNSTTCTYRNGSQSTAETCRKVENLVCRNDMGDREKAIALLQEQFENVFEIPV